MSDCSDLIGLRYRLGADGADGEIDCIHLVYTVLDRLQIATPPFKPAWYDASWRQVARDLLSWGYRIDSPAYDGDILLFRQGLASFAVAWQTGILYISPLTERVNWCPVSSVTDYRCFRSRGS